jgi:hypothetical protein
MLNLFKPKRDAIPNWQIMAHDRVKQAVEIYFGAPTRMRSLVFLTTSTATHKDGCETRVVTLFALLYCDKALPRGDRMDQITATFLIERSYKDHEWSFGGGSCLFEIGPRDLEWYQRRTYMADFTVEKTSLLPLVNVCEKYKTGCGADWDMFWRTGHHLGDRVVQPREYRTIDENVA